MSFLRVVRGLAIGAAIMWAGSASAVPVNNFVVNLESPTAPGWGGTAEFSTTSSLDPNSAGSQSIELQMEALTLQSFGGTVNVDGTDYVVRFSLDSAPTTVTYNIEFPFGPDGGVMFSDQFFDILVQVEYLDMTTMAVLHTFNNVDFDFQLPAFDPLQELEFTEDSPNPASFLVLNFADTRPIVVEFDGTYPSTTSGGDPMAMSEPGTAVLLGVGLLGMVGWRRRRQQTTRN